jgi:molecular chaperone GrpE
MKKEEHNEHKEHAQAAAPEAEDKSRQLQEQMLRMRADFDNTKKRLEREKMDSIKYANEKLLEEALPVMDDIDRAVASLSEGHDAAKVIEGLKLAQQKLHQVLERHGVQPVKALGEEFDPNVHEALGMVVAPDKKDGTVVDEIQRGYLLNGRLIRPSRVRIVQNTQD